MFGIITHEIGHALGFFHTQSRYDRDSYVTVQTQNMNQDAQTLSQFEKLTSAGNNNFGIGYDYGSVMHYKDNAVSFS